MSTTWGCHGPGKSSVLVMAAPVDRVANLQLGV